VGARLVWLAASTHPADEEAVLAAHQEVLETYPDALLIFAPRHPNRGLPLQKLAQSKTLSIARRSLDACISTETQVYIADTLGELGVFFTLCPITFLGGSFGQEGGHNPYEAIRFESALLHGPHVKNFIDAYEALHRAGAAKKIKDARQLGPTIVQMLTGDQAVAIGQAGLAFSGNTEDCTLNYVELITRVLTRTAT